MKKQILNTSELAERFGVSRITIYRWAKSRRIPAFKISDKIAGGREYNWRFRIKDVEKFERNRIKKQCPKK